MNGDHVAIHLGAIDGENTTCTVRHHLAIYSKRKWYCIKCRQCDVPNVHYSKKLSNDLVNSWILTYCEATRRWRKSFVVAMHPEKSAVMLVKWWNGGYDGTSLYHLCIIYLSSMYFLTTIIDHLSIIFLSCIYDLIII